MVVETVAAAALSVAGTKGLEVAVEKLSETALSGLVSAFRKKSSAYKARQLSNYVEKITTVRILTKPNENIHLDEVFVLPAGVQNGKKLGRLDSVRALPDGNVVIEAVGGHGKSFLMRYLCANLMADGECLPIFAELRRLPLGQSLREFLMGMLPALGVSASKNAFESLAAAGKLVLFLDGFDEVAASRREKILNDIEQLADEYVDMRILVSARPGTGISYSSRFSTIKLMPLDNGQRKELIGKLCDGAASKSLMDSVAKNAQVFHLLETPLLITLMVVVFRTEGVVPNRVIDYYGQLFLAMMRKHDAITKPEFMRERKSNLGDYELTRVFNGVSYHSLNGSGVNFSELKFDEYVKKSVAQLCIKNASAPDVASDIVSVSCLIIKDGVDEYRFCHKSVQEFYAANFIAVVRPERDAVAFLNHASIDKEFRAKWEGVLGFIKQINEYLYCRHFYLPYVERLFPGVDIKNKENKLRIADLESGVDVIGTWVVEIRNKSASSISMHNSEKLGVFEGVIIHDVAVKILHKSMTYANEKQWDNCSISVVDLFGLTALKEFCEEVEVESINVERDRAVDVVLATEETSTSDFDFN